MKSARSTGDRIPMAKSVQETRGDVESVVARKKEAEAGEEWVKGQAIISKIVLGVRPYWSWTTCTSTVASF
jgi:hypothetical protein